MEQRNRIARAIAMADSMGPEDFDDATEAEQREYDHMALAALDAAHLYAIHTVDMPETLMALAEVATGSLNFTLTWGNDQYRDWGEVALSGEPRHVVIGVSDPEAVNTIGKVFDAWGVFGDLTDHSDWSETADDVEYAFSRNWSDWTKNNSISLG